MLWTGSDVVLIDWEGDPSRPLEERRLQGSPLRDVAGMLHSFHSAAYAALADTSDGPVLEQWVRFWCAWASAAFQSSP